MNDVNHHLRFTLQFIFLRRVGAGVDDAIHIEVHVVDLCMKCRAAEGLVDERIFL
jgi:hypothetical protein